MVPLREIKADTSHMMAAKKLWPEGADAAGPLLSVKHLSKSFQIRKGSYFGKQTARTVIAVDDVSFDIKLGTDELVSKPR